MSKINELELLSKGYLQVGNIPNNEKLVIGNGGDHHHTLHFGFKSGILDFHKTYHDDRPQETLFEIRHFTLARILVKFRKPLFRSYFKYWFSTRIGVGKLKKYKCFLSPVTTDEITAREIVDITRAGKRFRFKKKIHYEKIVDRCISPDELVNASPGAFLVYRLKKGGITLQGIIIKYENQVPQRSFMFCNIKNYNAYLRDCTIWMYKLLRESQIEIKYKKPALALMWEVGIKKYIQNKPVRKKVS